jgi:hypothetical protein
MGRNHKIKFFLIMFFFFLGGYMLIAQEYVCVYFTDWNYDRFLAYDEDGVRNSPEVYIRIYDATRIENMKYVLKGASVWTEGRDNIADIVIDFVRDDKIYETYVINRFYFYKKGELTNYSTPKEILLTWP